MLHISEGGVWIKLLKSGQFGGKQGVKELGVQVVDCQLNNFSTARIFSLRLKVFPVLQKKIQIGLI